MNGLADYEKAGLNDLFKINDNSYILKPLAKLLSKHLLNPETQEEALKIIILHSESSNILLNKRIITKDILLKYLHINNIPVASDFTKSVLIDKIQNYWKEKFTINAINNENYTPVESTNEYCREFAQPNQLTNNKDEYPIQLLAKQFSEWFFNGWNKNTLKEIDFWSDSTLNVRLIDGSGAMEDYHDTVASNIISRIYEIQQKYNFIFNPNTSNEKGSKGSMDSHGLVMVLSCGTLHVDRTCVGIFESTFGLVRDIEAENNWKIKNINLLLKSVQNLEYEPKLHGSTYEQLE